MSFVIKLAAVLVYDDGITSLPARRHRPFMARGVSGRRRRPSVLSFVCTMFADGAGRVNGELGPRLGRRSAVVPKG